MNFSGAVKTGFIKCTAFSGRASRSEFWWFQLFTIVAYIPLAIVDALVLHAAPALSLGNLFGIVTLLPCCSLGVRRMHDINRRGWLSIVLGILSVLMLASYFFVPDFNDPSIQHKIDSDTEFAASVGIVFLVTMFLWLVVMLMIIVLWIFAAKKGTPGPNRYGPDPLASPAA